VSGDTMVDGGEESRLERRRRLNQRIKELLVEHLGLEVDPEWITDDQPLFGRGLELDSLDAIEILITVEFEFEVVLPDDDPVVVSSVNAIADRIEAAALSDPAITW
jgi:acyl carrier protein